MKILNLPLIVHEDVPNLDLARAIIQIDSVLENEIYDIAAKEHLHGLSGAQRRAGNEISFIGWFGASPPRPVTEVSLLITGDTIQWMGVYEDLTLSGNLRITLETEPFRLDELKAIQDEDDAPKLDVVFVTVWQDGELKSPAKLNPVNGMVHLMENKDIPEGYEIFIEEDIEFSGGSRLPVAKFPSSGNVYIVFPADFKENEDLFTLSDTFQGRSGQLDK